MLLSLKIVIGATLELLESLGMDEEEVLRLCQISGMEHLFSDKDFSRSWESEDVANEWIDITDERK